MIIKLNVLIDSDNFGKDFYTTIYQISSFMETQRKFNNAKAETVVELVNGNKIYTKTTVNEIIEQINNSKIPFEKPAPLNIDTNNIFC